MATKKERKAAERERRRLALENPFPSRPYDLAHPFVRQAARPVRIVNPLSGQAISPPSPPPSTSTLTPNSLDFPPLPTKSSKGPPKVSQSFLEVKSGAAKSQPERISDPSNSDDAASNPSEVVRLKPIRISKNLSIEAEPGFNVYARPFVPEYLTIISKLHGHLIETPAGRQFDYSKYVCGYFPFHFLPKVSQSVVASSSVGAVYTQTVQRVLNDEIQAQIQENELYTLFGHDVEIPLQSFTPGHPLACTLTVPGLLENSPYVEEGDLVELRQLCPDPHNNRIPFGMDRWLAARPPFPVYDAPGVPAVGGRWIGEPAPGWTGVIYNARVLAVRRKREQLTLQVSGLGMANLAWAINASSTIIRCNIAFPIQKDRHAAEMQVLPSIQSYLDCVHESVDSNGNTPKCSEHWMKSMLRPNIERNELQTKLNPAFHNRDLFDKDLNWEQKKAVESICRQNYGVLPFLISGPPGTGKTKTLVETALQLVHNSDKMHILVCAPSDPAADTLVQRLSVHLNHSQLLRLNRVSRTFDEVPDSLLRFCYIDADSFSVPPLKQLMAYKVVVTTCRDAQMLMYSRTTNSDLCSVERAFLGALNSDYIPPKKVRLHWSALLIDEAAQALESEALISLSVVAPPLEFMELELTPLVVMAGDQYQLGPRTSLRNSALKTSLFARLFDQPVYANHPLARGEFGEEPPTLRNSMLPIHRPAFANLIRNYRSHPAILAVPSALFYHDTLEPEAAGTNRLASWDGWKGAGWPVLFHNNTSPDDLETDGGGWYNSGEAEIACQYAVRLVASGLVGQKEICIMSPFKSQVARLRKLVREPRFGSLWDVDIGPMEAFQGLERGVVILCTTRSRKNYVSKDKALDWGVIGMPNKMNMTLTRAKFGLIVIGKKDVLIEDLHWNAWIQFCDRNGLLDGETNGIKVIQHGKLTRLERILLSQDKDDDGDFQSGKRQMRVYPQEDEMWTHGMVATSAVADIDAAMAELELEEEEGIEEDDYYDEEYQEERGQGAILAL